MENWQINVTENFCFCQSYNICVKYFFKTFFLAPSSTEDLHVYLAQLRDHPRPGLIHLYRKCLMTWSISIHFYHSFLMEGFIIIKLQLNREFCHEKIKCKNHQDDILKYIIHR